MDLDEILEEIGGFGKFQVVTLAVIFVPLLFAAVNTLSYVFVAGIPDYRCVIPACDGPDSQYNETWLHWSVPNDVGAGDGYYKAAKCERFINNFTDLFNLSCSKDAFLNQTEQCHEWIFDKSEITIVSDFNLTCLENEWKISLLGTLNFGGICVGSILFGMLADKYGRKLIFIFCAVFMSISGILQAFSTNYLIFAIISFIKALGTGAIYPLTFIIAIEMVRPTKRDAVNAMINYCFALGEALLALIAWMCKDWTWLLIAMCVPTIVQVIFCHRYIPESVRWLMVKGKTKTAKKVLSKVAKVNGKTLPDYLFESFERQPLTISSALTTKETDTLSTLKTILRSTKFMIRLIVLFIVWAISSFVYFGLSLNSTSLAGNKYLNFALVCLIEIPGYTVAWICLSKFGRRMSLIGSLFICGITCCVGVIVPSSMYWMIMLLFLIGKMGASSAFSIITVHTSELLPTVIRSKGMGIANTLGTVSAMLAAFVPHLGSYIPSLPMILFGSGSMMAGLLAIKLPETSGITLPDTVEDAEKL